MCLVPVFRCRTCRRIFRYYKQQIYRCSSPLCVKLKQPLQSDEPCNAACFSEHCGHLMLYKKKFCSAHNWTMCVRSVYYCQDCQTPFAIPYKRLQDFAFWKKIFCTDFSKHRTSLRDWLCDYKFCLRQSESGYVSCLGIKDNCKVCIGKNVECYNQYIYVPCYKCYEKFYLKNYNFEPYCFPMHYRKLNK